MLPIVSIFNLVSALFFGGITLKLYLSYKKKKDENLGNFFKGFLSLTILLVLIASPGLIFSDLKTISLMYAIYPFFTLLGVAYFGVIPLKVLGWKKTKELFFRSMVGIAVVITFFNIIDWQPAIVHQQAPFIYWEDTRGDVMNIILGAVLGLTLLLIAVFFINQGLKSSDKFVKIRAFFIAAGIISLIMSAGTNFIFGASAQEYLGSIMANFFNVLAAVLIAAGIYYKPKTSS
ncbi:MAG: hypothetical protein PHE52_02345 [Candidatus Pacebacteria bacterium]|nr:hypothetical protein [Candidatus Paceibacterota bacterium]